MIQEGKAVEEKFRESKTVLMYLGNVPDGKAMNYAVGCLLPEGCCIHTTEMKLRLLRKKLGVIKM